MGLNDGRDICLKETLDRPCELREVEESSGSSWGIARRGIPSIEGDDDKRCTSDADR